MSMVLECKETSDFKPHPEGIHPAICLDVIDLGMVKTEYQGEHRIVPKVKLVFESEQKTEDGRNCTISKNFTASLHPKARLAEFLGKWRGRPVLPGEAIDLGKLIGVCCTLVISHQQNFAGKTYASIDAISKPTKKLNASGGYDPAATRQRIAEWQAKGTGVPATAAAPRSAIPPVPQRPVPSKSSAPAAAPLAKAASAAVEDNISFDPEVGF